jgi:hypothetical protein
MQGFNVRAFEWLTMSQGHCGILTRTSAHLASTGFTVFPVALKKSKISLRNIETPLSRSADFEPALLFIYHRIKKAATLDSLNARAAKKRS